MLETKGAIKFYTLGVVRHEYKKEHLQAHGIVRDIRRYEGGKVKLGIEPIMSLRGFLRTLPFIKLFIPPPSLFYLPEGEYYFIESLFHPSIEEAIYFAEKGVDINLTYCGDILGEPAFDELKILEALQTERFEKGIYRLGLYRVLEELSDIVTRRAEPDKQLVKEIAWMMRELSKKGVERPKALTKEELKKAEELGVPVEIIKKGEEALPTGEGKLASLFGRFRGGEE